MLVIIVNFAQNIEIKLHQLSWKHWNIKCFYFASCRDEFYTYNTWSISWLLLLLQNINSFVYRKSVARVLSRLWRYSIPFPSFLLFRSYSLRSHVCFIFFFLLYCGTDLPFAMHHCHCIYIINDIHIVRAGKSSTQPYSFNNNKNNNNRNGKWGEITSNIEHRTRLQHNQMT